MATAPPLASESAPAANSATALERASAGAQSLTAVPVEAPSPAPDLLDPILARIPIELDVSVPMRNFRVKNLLTLEPGSVIESQWNHGADLPLAAGHVALAWAEFEVIDTRLGVRITRLA